MIYVNSETILNNDRFFSPYMRKVIHSKGEKHLTITYFILFINDISYMKLVSRKIAILHRFTCQFISKIIRCFVLS